jgi:hypothetical protein
MFNGDKRIMKKQTNITQDDRQTRSTIPREFVEEFKITKEDKVEWESRNKKLTGKLIKYADKSKIKGVC